MVPGVSGGYELVADYTAGHPALAAMLGRGTVELKGRLSLEKAAEFFANLRRSRTRTISAALLRCAGGSAAGIVRFRELVRHYRHKRRGGVAEPAPGAEAYFLPPSGLAAKVLRTARRGAVSPAARDTLPTAVSADQLLVVLIHRKARRASVLGFRFFAQRAWRGARETLPIAVSADQLLVVLIHRKARRSPNWGVVCIGAYLIGLARPAAGFLMHCKAPRSLFQGVVIRGQLDRLTVM